MMIRILASSKLLPRACALLVRLPFPYNFRCNIFPHNHVYLLHTRNIYKCNISERKNDDKDDFSKNEIISRLNFQCEEDSLPFRKLSIKTLLQIYKITKRDEENKYCINRLYYLSSRLECPPAVLSKLLVKRTFVYTLSFDWLKSSLDVLLDFNVPQERILRDLWVLKYHHKTIEERLLRIRDCGIDNLYPWMVRCSEDILNRFIEICQETKTILKEAKSTKLYLAQRLKTTPETIDDIYVKVPTLKCIRVTKVKNFLDFLLNEGFDVEDIAKKPRVLAASQKTISKRLQQLRDLGLQEINLNVLCRSRKDFKKFCESFKPLDK